MRERIQCFGPFITLAAMFVWVSPALASDGEGMGHNFAVTFFWIAIILLAAKISSLVEHFGQPSVLGELVLGVVLGNLALIGIGIFETPKNEPILNFLAELGVVILLFQVVGLKLIWPK